MVVADVVEEKDMEPRCKHGWLISANQCPDCAELERLHKVINELEQTVRDLRKEVDELRGAFHRAGLGFR